MQPSTSLSCAIIGVSNLSSERYSTFMPLRAALCANAAETAVEPAPPFVLTKLNTRRFPSDSSETDDTSA